jgi:hypothetical protein
MVLNKRRGITCTSLDVVWTLRDFLDKLCNDILHCEEDDWKEIKDKALQLLLKSTSAMLLVDGIDSVNDCNLKALVEHQKQLLLANETVQVCLGAEYFDVPYVEEFGVLNAPSSLASTRVLWFLLEKYASVPNFVLIRVPEDRSAKSQHFSPGDHQQFMCSVEAWENFVHQGVLIHAKSFLDCQYIFKCV